MVLELNMGHQTQTENTIIAELQQGSEKGLNVVFKLFNRPLLYFALQYVKNQEVAEEIVADVFVKVWQKRLDFQDLSKVKAFLYIAVKNASLNYLRTSIAQQEISSIEEWHDLQCQSPDVLKKIIKTELVKKIYEEMHKLPETQREVFHLFFIEDLEVEDISKRLGMSISAVYTNKSRAISSLRKNLQLIDATYLWLILFWFS